MTGSGQKQPRKGPLPYLEADDGRDDAHLEAAIAIFRLNVELHPGSANVHDSLWKAYLVADRLELAERSYQRVLELDPRLDSTRNALRRIPGRDESVKETDP